MKSEILSRKFTLFIKSEISSRKNKKTMQNSTFLFLYSPFHSSSGIEPTNYGLKHQKITTTPNCTFWLSFLQKNTLLGCHTLSPADFRRWIWAHTPNNAHRKRASTCSLLRPEEVGFSIRFFSDYDQLSSFSKMSKFWRFSAILEVDFVKNTKKTEKCDIVACIFLLLIFQIWKNHSVVTTALWSTDFLKISMVHQKTLGL